jgi:hypothetical protein
MRSRGRAIDLVGPEDLSVDLAQYVVELLHPWFERLLVLGRDAALLDEHADLWKGIALSLDFENQAPYVAAFVAQPPGAQLIVLRRFEWGQDHRGFGSKHCMNVQYHNATVASRRPNAKRTRADVTAAKFGAAYRSLNAKLRRIHGERYMPLQLKDLAKLNQIIQRIQAGNFDANDVDNLLMKLRAYAGEKAVFLEVANFVAHSDARDRGLAQQSITAFVDSLSYFQDYISFRFGACRRRRERSN